MSMTFSKGHTHTHKKKEKYAIYEIGITYLSNAKLVLAMFFMIWKCKYDYRNLRHISKRYLLYREKFVDKKVH